MKGFTVFAVLLWVFMMAGCGGSSSSSAVPEEEHQVVGLVALPAATDQVYNVYLDTDDDPSNGYAALYQHFCDCGDYVEYYFDGVAPGYYYLYAETLSDDGLEEFFGFYDPTDPDGVTLVKPESPNVVITLGKTFVLDFNLGVL